jgi:hypothetical protein
MTWLLDELIKVPGTNLQVGLDPIIGLLPGGGDMISGAVSTYALVVAAQLGAPATVIMRMGLNILIDTIVGAVPLLGDLFDVTWKANRKNVALIEEYTRAPTKTKRASMAIVVVTIMILLVVVAGVAWGTFWVLRSLFHALS